MPTLSGALSSFENLLMSRISSPNGARFSKWHCRLQGQFTSLKGLLLLPLSYYGSEFWISPPYHPTTRVAQQEAQVSLPILIKCCMNNISYESAGQDKEFCTLVSRVASLGRLRHKAKGYSGPLSRSLLAYHSIISTLHVGMRDLLEMNMISMFLEGSVNRNRRDWMELSIG